MPRLFTGLEIPTEIADRLSVFRGGLMGARWVDPANYHVTVRFLGDVDNAVAREAASALGETRARPPFTVTIDGLSAFGGSRPRALIARVAPTSDLTRLQAEHERAMRRIGLEPETRKFTPHVTLARFRDATAAEVAGFLATRGHVPPLSFVAERFVLFSARESVGGGPYVVEAAYPFEGRPAAERPREDVCPASRRAAMAEPPSQFRRFHLC